MKDPVAAADQHYRNAHPQDDGKQWHAFVLWFLLTCPTTIMAKLCSGKSPNKLCCNAETGGAIRRAGPALLQAVELDVRAGGDDLGQHLRTAGGRTASLESLGEPLQHAFLEGGDHRVVHVALAADRGCIGEIVGRRPHRLEHLLAGVVRASASSTLAEASSVRKSFNEIFAPAISRRNAFTSCAVTLRTSPVSVRD